MPFTSPLEISFKFFIPVGSSGLLRIPNRFDGSLTNNTNYAFLERGNPHNVAFEGIYSSKLN